MALCLSPIPDAVYQPFATVSGTFVSVPIPCEPIDEYPCPTCLTLALQTSDRLYYLTADNADIQTQLEAIEYQLSLTTNITGSVSGTPYTEESYEYIRVQAVDTNSAPLRLPSICDEWNVLEHLAALGPDYESFSTLHFRLTTDTIINATRYVKLEQEGIYKGAMREGTNADIYYVPNNSTHEYLLYAFNAQVGDSLDNLWFGANENENYLVSSATVVNIEPTTPRKFTIDFEWQSIYSYAAINDTSEIMHAELVWLEGLGFQYGGPLNYECPFDCAGAPGMFILCAYKNGEKVYADPYWSEKVGCEYNRHTLPSLCDEWNVWHESFESYGPISFDKVVKYQLTTDTLINGQQYVKLTSDKDSPYLGAMREGNNRDIYYVPAGSTNEFLLYAFNAQVGEVLNDLYLGGFEENGYSGRVEAISDSNPRIFTVGVNIDEYTEYPVEWIEGVGSPETPCGLAVVPPSPADVGTYSLLCAYNKGEQVYVSNMGEQHGCEYNYNPDSTPSDTIPLYIKDGPGSSTIEPVDPNEIIAQLIHDELQMKEYLHTIIDYNLTKAPAANSSPAVKHVNPVVAADSFTDSETVTLTESGRYFLEMSHPDWDYTIVGTFVYNALQGLETIENSQSACTKELREGQLLIRQGEQLYTPTGIRIQ